MKITIYELLGMVKDDKAPEKIKYHDEILYFDDETKNYYNDEDMHSLFSGVGHMLNNEVEIIKEEKKIPEKINNGYTKQSIEDMKEARFNSNDMAKICNRIGWLMENRNELSNKIDEIIDYLKSKGE